MALIGNIVVGVIANTQKAVRNVRKFRAETRSMASTAKKAIGPIGSFATAVTGIGLGISAAGLAAALKSSAERIDGIAKSARKLGVATDRLVGFHHAAEQSGLSTEKFNNSTQRMIKNISKAAQGDSKIISKTLNEIGLSAENLNRMKPEQQIEAIADRMKGMTNSSDKLRIAVELFGREGASMINMLDMGSAGLQKMQKDAEKLNLTFSDEEAKNIEKMNDQLDRLRKSFGGAANKLVITLGPGVAETVEGLLLLTSRGKNGRDESRSLAGDPRIVERQQRAMFLQREGEARFGKAGYAQAIANNRRREKLEAKRAVAASGARKGLFKSAKSIFNVAKANVDALKPTAELIAKTATDVQRMSPGKAFALAATADARAIQFDKSVEARRKAMANKPFVDNDPAKINSAIERGTSAAFLALRANVRNAKDDVPKQHLAESVKQTELLSGIKAAVANAPTARSIPL